MLVMLFYLLLVLFVLSVSANNFSFPAGSPWYQDVSQAALDPNSTAIMNYLLSESIWSSSPKFQIDFSINIQYASTNTPRYTFVESSGYYLPDCDTLSTFPVSPGGQIEGESPYNTPCSGDCHYLIVDQVYNKLYESYNTQINTTSQTIQGLCGVKWDLCLLYPNNLRGDQCTSTDAAGFPIAPLLITADELASGEVNHAIRFILPNNVMKAGYYTHPASHAGAPSSTNPYAIPYGTRLRLKSSFNPNTSLTETPISNAALVVVAALKKYGMFLADGGNLPLTFADDAFTTNKYANLGFDSHALFGITPTDFEVVAHATPEVLTDNCVRNTTFPLNACNASATPAPTPTPKPARSYTRTHGAIDNANGLTFSFPAGSPWYQDISSASLDPDSTAITSYLSSQGVWSNSPKFQVDFSINIQYAYNNTPRYTYTQSKGYYTPDCDDITAFPVTPDGLIEGESPYNKQCDGDCHYLVVDAVNNKLYENFVTQINTNAKTIQGDCGVVWDLCRLYPNNLRGDQCTSTDAAGFPIAPLLVTADELAAGAVNHALRFILPNNAMKKGYYIHPASHAGAPSNTNANSIAYGTRLRLKASFNTSVLTEQPVSKATLAVVAALKKYGMFLADGGNLPLTFADDMFTKNKYADLGFDSHSLYGIKPTDFEVVAHDTPTMLTDNCVRNNLPPLTC